MAQYDPVLQYGRRAGRYEGLRTEPVSGYDVVLLKAEIDHRRLESWQDTVRLGFYLPRDVTPGEVSVTVRQYRPKSGVYWLDRVTADWRTARYNEYSWPATDVLTKLPSRIGPSDVGAVVRLGKEGPAANRQRVAPAVLNSPGPPQTVEGYRFTLKANAAAKVTCTIYRGDRGNQAVFQRPRNDEKAGSPFTIRWRSGGQPEGPYRLRVSALFQDNTRREKEILFEHRSTVLPGRGVGGGR